MRISRVTSLALLALFSTSASVGAADAAKPLRVLVYNASVSSRSRISEQVSGFSGFGGGTGGTHADRTSSEGDSGTVTFSIMKVTADGGLLIDCAFESKAGPSAPVTIGLYGDGRLAIPANAVPAQEIVYLLPMLARGFVAGRAVDVGTKFSVPQPAPLKGNADYTVTSVDGSVAALTFSETRTMPGPRGFDAGGTGRATYDLDKLRPNSYVLDEHARRQPSSTMSVEDDTHVEASLVSDTFDKK
jgi:hypothetical protein